MIHAVKITGNIGQQVEIFSSDQLNGEYNTLTYITLPSTELIYNDNRKIYRNSVTKLNNNYEHRYIK